MAQAAATPETLLCTVDGRNLVRASRRRPAVLAAAVISCLALLGTGCGSSASAPTIEKAVLQKAPAQPSSAGAIATGSERRALAARYLAIARAGNRGLDHSLDPLEGPDKDRLRPARADLRYAANVEHTFDRRLLQIPFPPRTEQVALTLYRVNQARAGLTATAAARSTSLAELHAYQARLDQANTPVEVSVRTIRRQLGLPPPPGS